MSHIRLIYTILTMPIIQAHSHSRKPLKWIGETDELGIKYGPQVYTRIHRRVGHDLPDASCRSVLQRLRWQDGWSGTCRNWSVAE